MVLAWPGRVPSFLHQTLVRLFEDRPRLVGKLLAERAPPGLAGEVRVAPGDIGALTPTELRADLVLLAGAVEAPRLALALEVQLAVDPAKRRSWPHYVANLHLRHRCPVLLVVVTPRAPVARWAAEPIEIGPGFTLVPQVLGPHRIPEVADPVQARCEPELAVLSSLAHPDRVDIALAALLGVLETDDEHGPIHADMILVCLAPAAHATLEALMAQGS